MKRLILVAACLAGHAKADIPWFTIIGDRNDPNADTIEMNPVAVSRDGPVRVMEIRVSRSAERTSGDGVKFRSFRGEVEFDCSRPSARFVRSKFFAEPLWESPTVQLSYPPSKLRPMEFRLFDPNPKDKVIRAACQG
jgi:hypothetical protein